MNPVAWDEPDAPAIVMTDADGRVIGWSEAAEKLLGYHADEVLHRSSDAFMEPGDRTARGREPRWSGLVTARHRAGGAILLHVEGVRLRTAERRESWLLTLTPDGQQVLEPILSRAPVAIGVWDTGLRCVWLNETARRLSDVFPFFRLGSRPEVRAAGFDAEATAGAMRRVLEDGTPVLDRESRRTSENGLTDHVLSTSFYRLDGADGRPLGVCAFAVDTSHSRARDRLALLGEASIRIGSTLDVMRTAQELAELAVPRLADYVTVDVSERVLPDDGSMRRLGATEVSVPKFHRAGVASIHRELPESLWRRGEVVYVPPSSPFTAVLSTGRSHFEPVMDTSSGTWLDVDPDRARVIHDTGMHSLIIVPLKARGDILGVAVFVRTDNSSPFGKDDLELAEMLAARAALSLDNARQYTRERTAALALQRDLLPRNLSGAGAVDVAWRYLPSDVIGTVGGDWFDVVPLGDGRVALVVGDVTGHGINAAATMGRLRTAVRTLSYQGLPPDEVLALLDRMVVRLAEEDAGAGDEPLDTTGATCVYAVYDPLTRRCAMSVAGHPPPAIVHPSGEVTFAYVPGGTPVGLGLGSYECVEIELAEGSLIALYTDGLVERRGADIDAGLHRLSTVLAAPGLAPEDLCDQVIGTMVDGTPSEDDIALLIARTRTAAPARS
ncbi:SpoIIE family protein phosphatase [Nonomuraea mesophila]|nr:SpoIIE family protein phosphatase [Nonomuraea mesophila]